MKLAFAVCLVIGTVAAPYPLASLYGAIALFLLMVLLVSRIPVAFVVRRLLMLQPFVAGVMLLAVVRPEGWAVAARIAVKSNLCLTTMVLLANTTPFASLIGVLVRLRVPRLLITILSLMYRYIFVLIDQAERMSRARRSRTFVRRRGSWKGGAGIIGQLFIRSTERAERVYAAMTARGWRL
jgi:cobalt/nickel transport system permease protein